VFDTQEGTTVGGFQSTVDSQLAALRETRNIIDNNLVTQ